MVSGNGGLNPMRGSVFTNRRRGGCEAVPNNRADYDPAAYVASSHRECWSAQSIKRLNSTILRVIRFQDNDSELTACSVLL
jgi:hypothetical protein